MDHEGYTEVSGSSVNIHGHINYAWKLGGSGLFYANMVMSYLCSHRA